MIHIEAAKTRLEDLWAKGIDYDENQVAEALKENRMIHLDMDFTGNCKLKCFYCDRTPDRFNDIPDRVELTTQERKDIILQAKNLGAETVEFPGAGEPMIDVGFWEVLEYIHELNMTSVIFTSGYHLDDKSIDRLYKLNATLIIKYNNIDAAVQDKMVGVKGYAAKANIALNKVLDRGFNKTIPTRVGIDMVVTPQFNDMAGIKDVFRWCRNNNIHTYIQSLIPEGRGDNNKVIQAQDQNNQMIEEFRIIDEKEFGIKYIPRRPMAGGYRCRQVNIGIFVNLFGEVYDCNGLGRILGHLRVNSLEDVWNAKFAKQVRKPIQNGFCLLRERVWDGVEETGNERKLEQYKKWSKTNGKDEVLEKALGVMGHIKNEQHEK